MSRQINHRNLSPTWGLGNGFKLVGDLTYPIEVNVEHFNEHNFIALRLVDEKSFSTEVRLGLDDFKKFLTESGEILGHANWAKKKKFPQPDATDIWRENLKAWLKKK